MLKEILLSTLTGAVVGFVFAFFKLPIPAPTAIQGIMGIVGIFLGYQLYRMFF
ncbi:XapX domain-containing protein [Tepidibacillus fermentans]|uniref:XapX domain-containing protein n=1 Tax=Tepidibacillus fermentans TaxID=1281767 RepID=A0A4R3KG59_9BACI|nr:XapX domain-containing protein [Tepidibacillus fermentans]TCS82083.1 XapX domain-containing protein [Tepidibacillus fermentans]